MAQSSANFVGDIPAHYDEGLGPNIFVDYADRIADTCAAIPAGTVLEIAAGTGIVSRRLRDRLGRGTTLVVTDLNAPMVEVARSKFTEGENVRFEVANAMELPFGDGAFDLAVCQFGVMFFPDKVASFREVSRVLSPHGCYVFNVWSRNGLNPFSQIAHSVIAGFFPEDPPVFYKVPFHYDDPDRVRHDLMEAGWHRVSHETIKLEKQIVDLDRFARALVYGNPVSEEIQSRGGVDPEAVVTKIRDELEAAFQQSDMVMPLEATTFVCRKG
jgi:ubiquinone/menaquinone biosynthesis C-methylase UbiE